MMSDTQAVATVKIDNAQVRVTVVPLVTGSLAATGAAGETTSALRVGEPYYRDAGVEHDVRNPNPFEFAFIEIELKGAPGA